ncbi:MAG: hypothetical protein QXK88_02365 [Desulfurococcaceae archaeon]
MSHRCDLDPLLRKMKLERAVSMALDEALALSLDYVKICRTQGEIKACAYLQVVVDLEECRVRFLGLSVSVPLSAAVDERISSLFKYAALITSDKEAATFYIDKNYSFGVYCLVFRELEGDWDERKPADYEEVGVFIEG